MRSLADRLRYYSAVCRLLLRRRSSPRRRVSELRRAVPFLAPVAPRDDFPLVPPAAFRPSFHAAISQFLPAKGLSPLRPTIWPAANRSSQTRQHRNQSGQTGVHPTTSYTCFPWTSRLWTLSAWGRTRIDRDHLRRPLRAHLRQVQPNRAARPGLARFDPNQRPEHLDIQRPAVRLDHPQRKLARCRLIRRGPQLRAVGVGEIGVLAEHALAHADRLDRLRAKLRLPRDGRRDWSSFRRGRSLSSVQAPQSEQPGQDQQQPRQQATADRGRTIAARLAGLDGRGVGPGGMLTKPASSSRFG